MYHQKRGGGGGGVLQLNARCLKKYTKLIKRKLKIKILMSIDNVLIDYFDIFTQFNLKFEPSFVGIY